MWTFNFLALVSSIIAAGSGGIHAEENAVIIFGGGIDEGKAEAYPASCNLDLPEDTGNLCSIGATALDGSVYYCGGKTFAQGEYRKVCYQNIFGTWVEKDSMLFRRAFSPLVTVGSNIIAVGGWDDFVVHDTVEIFDGESWNLLPWKMTGRRTEMCVVPISDREVIMIGGYTGDDHLNTVEVYDIEEGWVATLPDMPTTRRGLACVMHKNEIYVAGGLDSYPTTPSKNTVEVLNLETLEWRTMASMNQNRHYLTMEVVNGSLTVFGGWEAGSKSLEVYTEGEWIEKPLGYNHVCHASVSLPCV